jgi:hypothetical protein
VEILHGRLLCRSSEGMCSTPLEPGAGKLGEDDLRSSQSGPSRAAQLNPWRIDSLTVFNRFLSTWCKSR